NKAPVFTFHILVREAQLPQQFHPAHLEPDEVIRVIYHTHLVGLRVTHPETRLVHLPLAVPIAHCPLQRGLRFSRNAAIPSRKSGVERMAAFSRSAVSRCLLSCSLA